MKYEKREKGKTNNLLISLQLINFKNQDLELNWLLWENL